MSVEVILREVLPRYNVPDSFLHNKISALNHREEVMLQPKIEFLSEYEQNLVEISFRLDCIYEDPALL